MSASLIDGKALAATILTNLKTQIDALGQPLHLAAVCVGDDPALVSFVRLKQKAAQSVGIEFSSYFFDSHDKEGAITTLQYLADDESVDGIFIELPLPKDWNTDELIALVPPSKDVDAFTAQAPILAPTVVALQYVLSEYDIDVRGREVAVVGQGRLVGAPITRWLGEQGAHVTIIDKHTLEPDSLTRQADLVISGVGIPGLITAEGIKDDAIVIDFGYGKNKNGVIAGDVDQDSVMKKAKLLTPVPGGMGPLLIAAILENLLLLATR